MVSKGILIDFDLWSLCAVTSFEALMANAVACWSQKQPATLYSVQWDQPMATFSDKIHNPDKRQKPHLKNNPEITAVPDSSLIKDITNIIRRDGGIIIKNFITPEEAGPYYQKVGKYEETLFPLLIYHRGKPVIWEHWESHSWTHLNSGFAGKSPTFAQKGINYLAYHEAAKLLLKEES